MANNIDDFFGGIADGYARMKSLRQKESANQELENLLLTLKAEKALRDMQVQRQRFQSTQTPSPSNFGSINMPLGPSNTNFLSAQDQNTQNQLLQQAQQSTGQQVPPAGIPLQPLDQVGPSPLSQPLVPTSQTITRDPHSGEESQTTSFKIDPRLEGIYEVNKAQTKEEAKAIRQAAINFGRSTSQFERIASVIKGKAEEQGGLGLIPGLVGNVKAGLKIPGSGRTAAFPGQIVETGLALNNILTGQNRVIKGVLSMILSTLPTGLDPEDQVGSKLDQSLQNSFALTMAIAKGDVFIKPSKDTFTATDSKGNSIKLPTSILTDKKGKELSEKDIIGLVNKLELTGQQKTFIAELSKKIRVSTAPIGRKGIGLGSVIEDFLPADITDEDIFETMKKHGKTRQEVVEALAKKLGIVIPKE